MVKAKRVVVEGQRIVEAADAAADNIEFVFAQPQVCLHPSGFVFIGKVSGDGVTVLDLTRCPHCGERRREAANGRVVASCVAGGEWMAWQ